MVARVGIEHSGKWLVFGCRSSSAFLGYRESYPGNFGVDFGIEPSTLGTILGLICAPSAPMSVRQPSRVNERIRDV